MSVKLKKIGEIGIDSGTVLIADPCYINDERFTVQSSTGYGDGVYPVYARIEDGRTMELRIIFDTPHAVKMAKRFGLRHAAICGMQK